MVPTASLSHGWLTGRGSIRARPLPAHSSVTAVGHPRTAAELIEGELERLVDETGDRECPVLGRGLGDVVVRQQIVQAQGRDVVAHRFERHTVVAGRQAELVEADAFVRLGHPARLADRLELGTARRHALDVPPLGALRNPRPRSRSRRSRCRPCHRPARRRSRAAPATRPSSRAG